MPKKPDSVRSAVLLAYFQGEQTVEQICRNYGVSRRTVYAWASGSHARIHSTRQSRKAIYLTLDEVELLLLLFLESNPSNPIAKQLEDRLLNVADELTERSLL